MSAAAARRIEELFALLVPDEKASVISHGIILRLSALQKRLSLAESKVLHFEKKHHISLDELDTAGLPDDAGYEMHEDYIMWHHWADVVKETRERIASLKEIAEQGLYAGEILYAGH